MKILETFDDGTPQVVQLTLEERLVSAIHENLMSVGYDQGYAMILLRGSTVSPKLRSPQPELEEVLDPQFVLWLTH